MSFVCDGLLFEVLFDEFCRKTWLGNEKPSTYGFEQSALTRRERNLVQVYDYVPLFV